MTLMKLPREMNYLATSIENTKVTMSMLTNMWFIFIRDMAIPVILI